VHHTVLCMPTVLYAVCMYEYCIHVHMCTLYVYRALYRQRTRDGTVVYVGVCREGRIQYIEDSFRAAKEPPVHPTNPALKVVEVLPLLPYLSREGQRFLHVNFGAEPAEDGTRRIRPPLPRAQG